MPKTFAELLKALPFHYKMAGDASALISAPVAEADADVQPGGLFVARAGLSVDGHDFIPRAIERGAAAIVGSHDLTDLPVPYARVKKPAEATGHLAAAFHDFPSRKMTVIGVTGTDGKTTTSTIIHSILQAATGGKAGLISTVNAVIGGETHDTGLHVTTPSAPQVQALLARMVQHGLEYAVLEATSHGLAQGRMNGVDVDVAVLTNLTHEHLDYHGSFEAYRDAKGRLFAMLGKSARKPNRDKVAIINADDANADFFAAYPADRVVRYGIRNRADFRGSDVVHRPGYTQFVVRDAKKTHLLHLPLAGDFNVYNALAAVAATRSLNLLIDFIRQGLMHVPPIPGRLERIDEGQAFVALVDFAHTPNALVNALTAARTMTDGGDVIAVFGSAGLRDREKRRLMAEAAADLADFTVLTAEDPRTESLDEILATMAAAMTAKGKVEGSDFVRIPDRGAALAEACARAAYGDVVIACGKGHEQSMCFGTIEYPWDDRDALRAALRGQPLTTLPTAKNS